MNPETKPWYQAHARADSDGEDGYVDPETGLMVFTRGFHVRRGFCCGSACRHCPYEHEAVPKKSSSHEP